jgi:hypothetical protein
VAPGEDRVFGERYGPTRASRAMAIVHIAMFDAAVGLVRRVRAGARATRTYLSVLGARALEDWLERVRLGPQGGR